MRRMKDIMNGIFRRYFMKTLMSPDHMHLSHGSTADGLSIDSYGTLDENYMDACYVALNILQINIFSMLGNAILHVKSLSGIREKLAFRQRPVNDMLRVTIY